MERRRDEAVQIKLARTKSAVAKQREFLWRLAEAQDRYGDSEAAEQQLIALLKMPLDCDEQRLEALCFLADIQVISGLWRGCPMNQQANSIVQFTKSVELLES